MSLSHRIATLLRGTDRTLFDLFVRAGENNLRAAQLLDQMLHGFPESQSLAAQIKDCEHEGDQITHDVINRMNQTFVTPIEREDALSLASALDDIADYIDEVADYLGLYQVEAAMDQSLELARIISDATAQLALALPKLHTFEDISEQVIEVHRLENDGDRIVREAIASLFAGRIDPVVIIRWKDLFERLEQAIDACERAADILSSIVIKNK